MGATAQPNDTASAQPQTKKVEGNETVRHIAKAVAVLLFARPRKLKSSAAGTPTRWSHARVAERRWRKSKR